MVLHKGRTPKPTLLGTDLLQDYTSAIDAEELGAEAVIRILRSILLQSFLVIHLRGSGGGKVPCSH